MRAWCSLSAKVKITTVRPRKLQVAAEAAVVNTLRIAGNPGALESPAATGCGLQPGTRLARVAAATV